MSRVRFKRFKVSPPPDAVLRQYMRAYPPKTLHFQPESLPPLTAGELFGADSTGRSLVLDLGCGRGEFVIEQALARPGELFAGIDYHQKSIWAAIHHAAKEKAENVRFIHADLRRVLIKVPDATVEEAFMLFPPTASIRRKRGSDPFPEDVLRQIYRVLVPGASFHFVSDHEGYFNWKRRMIEHSALFEVTALSRGFEGGQTRFQRYWEKLAIESKRLKCRKRDPTES